MKLSALPWNSSLFSWGVVALVFGIGGYIFTQSKTIPTLDELTVFTGALVKIEHWQMKNRTGVDIYVQNSSNKIRLNAGSCRYLTDKLALGQAITVNYKTASVARVDGRAFQIKNKNNTVCSYNHSVESFNRSTVINTYLSYFCLGLSVLLISIGYFKHNKSFKL